MKKFIKKHYLIILGLLLTLPAIWPLFNLDFFRMHDWLHVARLIELDTALKAGQFPPRWAPDFGWGFGMPLFHFYPPLPYYLAELLYLIKVPAVFAIKAIFGLNFLAGFYFTYLWTKEHWGKLGGFISGLAFVYLPYRAVQFYVRGSLAELTAMTFIPLFFYAVKKKNTILIALSIAGIFLSHNVIALFALIFIPIYWLFHLKSWRQLILSGILAFGLSAFFILPAFFEQSLTAVSKLAGGYSHYGFHFIYLRQLFSRAFAYGGSILGPYDDISFQLGWPHLVLMFPAIIILIKKRSKDLLALFILLGLSIFLMTFHSIFIWDKLTILHMAQFPWRLLAFSASFVAFFSGSIIYFIKNKKIQLIITFLIALTIICLNLSYFKPKEYSKPEDHYYTDRNKIKDNLGDILPDYLPKTAVKPAQPSQELFDLSKTAYQFSVDMDQTYTINQFYFPGWQAKLNNQSINIKPDEKTGLISFDLKAGEHQVNLELTKTLLQRTADLISLLSWVLVLGLILKSKFS
ncbi:hypothetical protein KKB06_05725 [Patescibacteria group bacterium]|nr:hypothetical protein [Patescibacteria group bacterium]